MKKTLLFGGILYASMSFSQVEISSNVIATAGTVVSNANLQMSFTFGETFTSTFNGTNTHSLGFQQGDLFVASVNEVENDELLLYPNPANEEITFKTSFNSTYAYNVYDISGRVVLSGTHSSNTLVLNLTSIVGGKYFIEYIPESGNTQYLPFITLH